MNAACVQHECHNFTMHFLADPALPLSSDFSTVIISLVVFLVVIIIIVTVVTVGLMCIRRLHLCAKQEQQEVVYDEVKYSKDKEQIRISTNEAYEVVPKMEDNAAYGVTCHQSSEVSSH